MAAQFSIALPHGPAAIGSQSRGRHGQKIIAHTTLELVLELQERLSLRNKRFGARPMNRNCLVMIALVAGSPALGLAVEPTRWRPNQYPSPTVKVPAAEEQFDADWPWFANT